MNGPKVDSPDAVAGPIERQVSRPDPERETAATRCRAEWQNVNDPPCHPSDADWRPCRLCEHAVDSAEWFAARAAEVRRDLAPLRLARMLRLYVATTEGLTLKKLARATGVGESTLSRFLNGERMPDGRAFAALLAYCLGEHVDG